MIKKIILAFIMIFAFGAASSLLRHSDAPSPPAQTVSQKADQAVVPTPQTLIERKSYAEKSELNSLKSGMDIQWIVQGKNGTTLKIQYVLMGRPLAYNLLNNSSLVETWKNLGFKTVILTDGFNSTWVCKLESLKCD